MFFNCDRFATTIHNAFASVTGESLNEAVLKAFRERLSRQRQRRPTPRSAKDILSDAQQRLSRIAVEGHGNADEILGYDEKGLPH
jgi:hypothetical protein